MKKWKKTEMPGYVLIENEGGKTIGYSPNSGINILEADGYAFKDLNRNGKLDPYEDWRLPVEERIKDLVGQMSVEQIAGLMLYSKHQTVSYPKEGNIFAMRFAGTYNGKPLLESGADVWDLTDQQKDFLKNDKVRHVTITILQNPEIAAKWNNNMQAYVEEIDLGIPVNTCSDPRHGSDSNGEFYVGADSHISMWPSTLGMAATFDPEVVKTFGKVAATEYRALGITTALSPQIDLATEPRWNRYSGTFGEGTKLAIDMTRAYCDGFQTSEGKDELEDGWGYDSVNTIVKHWPGGGSGEGGRDAHFPFGKYAVYPGNNLKEMLLTFTEGAFKLDGKTKQTSGVMPYYTISYNQDKKYGENVGNSYSKFIINDLLREKYGYDGVVCTDWGITRDDGTSWNTHHMNVIERHYKAIMVGIDQFGGDNDLEPVMAAYQMGVASHGEEYMRNRMEQSARRILRNIFRIGLFEDPYLDPKESFEVVGKPEFLTAGYETQLKSIVLLKNKGGVLPRKRGKVYIPLCHSNGFPDMFGLGFGKKPYDYEAVERSIAEKYFDIAETPEEADFAIVFMNSPTNIPYEKEKGYLPITLQYKPYKAEFAREHSIASGHPTEFESPDRSYKNKEAVATNSCDLDIFLKTREQMGDKPVIVSLRMANPTVMSEFEPFADAILVNFAAQPEAIFDIISGKFEPQGLMPCQTPKDMKTVELQFEDVPRDMDCHVDTCGNTYDFAFGLNWSGVINDDRVKKYK